MYRALADVTLSGGERVQAGVIETPDAQWAPRLATLLAHKGEPWNAQNHALLTRPLGIDGHYYVLHRDGQPLANATAVELGGVGLLGHVYTVPADRRRGAARALLGRLLAGFRRRHGRALVLATAHGTPQYHLYASLGFSAVEPGSGCMDMHPAEGREAFHAAYFASAPTRIEPICWRHWPASGPLFAGPWPGLVRCAPLGILGRTSAEGPLLAPILEHDPAPPPNQSTRVAALVHDRTEAVVGLAAWGRHPLWPDCCLLDVYCHPAYWQRGAELLGQLAPPPGMAQIAYADPLCPAKHRVLQAAGFAPTVRLAARLARDAAASGRADALVFERR